MHVRQTRRLVTPLLACVVALTVLGGAAPAYAEEPSSTSSTQTASEPTNEPTAAPASASASESESESTSEPTNEPTAAPASEPTSEPASETTAAPASEPTSEPAPQEATTTERPTPEAETSTGTSSYEQSASINSPTTTTVTLPSVSCASLGLSKACAAYVDLAGVEEVAQAMLTGCTAPSGECSAALGAAESAIRLADTCLDALGVGVTVADLALSGSPGVGVSLDCRYVAQVALDIAALVLRAANECATGYTSACAAVYDGIRLASNRALGCVNGALVQAGVSGLSLAGGTDPGCGNAVYSVQGIAAQLSALVANCAKGGNFCATLGQVGNFAAKHLTSCVGSLIIGAQQGYVTSPIHNDGTLDCYAAVDQVNTWANGTLGTLPEIPYSYSPTPDCTITIPGTPGTEGLPLGLLVPACTPWTHVTTTTPSPGIPMGLPGRECEPDHWVEATERYADRYSDLGGRSHHNRSASVVRWQTTYTQTTSQSFSVDYSVESEANMLFAKVKTKLGVGIQESMSESWSEAIDMAVQPNHLAEVSFGFANVVNAGVAHTRDSDCRLTHKNLLLKAPYQPHSWSDQQPYRR